MSIKVAVVTTSRADYGLLHPLITRLDADERFTAQIVVTGSHLMPHHGMTVAEIEADGFEIAARVALPAGDDSRLSTAVATGEAVTGLAKAFEAISPDVVVILGDRFEALSSAIAALILDIPVAHIHGGEVTLGSLDDPFRHAITKMATLHFASTEEYRRRIVQMGAQPEFVFDAGALAVDNVAATPLLTPQQFAEKFGVECDADTLLVTFHPVTRGGDSLLEQGALLDALDALPQFRVLFTAPNADAGGQGLADQLRAYVAAHPGRSALVASLGRVGYLSAVHNCAAVVGNSSSGLIEVPAAGVPSVDIGVRQSGRVRPASVVHCEADTADIRRAIELATSPQHRAFAASAPNPYGDGRTAEKIVDVLADRELLARARTATFHDIDIAGSGADAPAI